MSARRILREVLSEWKDFGLPKDLIRRDFSIDLSGRAITVLTGPRRAGKTYLMFQMMEELMESGVDENRIFYVNFEDERIEPRTEFLTELLPAIREEFGVGSNIYLFLDEIHNIPRWDRWLRRHELRDIKFVITGSTSELLPQRISEALGGRTETYVVYPLSFREFLRFKGLRVPERISHGERRAEILRLMEEYLKFGGFPEVVLLRSEMKKVARLQEYFLSVVYRDIVRRCGVDKPMELEVLVKLLADTTLFSASKMENVMRSAGFGVSKATILKYKACAEEAFLIEQLTVFSRKVKDAMQHPRKVYFIDTGMRYWISRRWRKSLGNVFENLVFLLLLRGLKLGERIHYWKDYRGHEADFVIEEGGEVKEVIQAAYDVDDYDVRAREVRGLVKAMKEFGLGKGVVVTWDYEGRGEVGGRTIEYVPVWRLALSGHRGRRVNEITPKNP